MNGSTPAGADGPAHVLVDGVEKTYLKKGGAPVHALRPVRLDLRRGEFLSLVGPSGCGKTTLLMIMAGLLDASGGTVSLDGAPVRAGDPRISVAFQQPTLLRWRTVWDNVILPSKIMGRLDAAARTRAEELLELTGLASFKKHYPHELSGGMQQRAAIARSLVSQPDLLLMDEPFAALDEFTREKLNDELLRLWSGREMTVVFVTHNISEAVYLSDRVAIMAPRPGRLIEVTDVPLARPRTPAIRGDEDYFRRVRDTRALLDHTSDESSDRQEAGDAR
ncbi:MAG TPA: ABC transporter ATP-binding protein [Streptosporangiaceae bacterium]